MSERFTRGPWHLKRTQHTDGTACYYICRGGGEIIARTETEDPSDVLLICFAPEMKELLVKYRLSWAAGDNILALHREWDELRARINGENSHE